MFIAEFPLKVSMDVTNNLQELGVPDDALIQLAKIMDLLILWGAINHEGIENQTDEPLEAKFHAKIDSLIPRNDH